MTFACSQKLVYQENHALTETILKKTFRLHKTYQSSSKLSLFAIYLGEIIILIVKT